MDWEPRPRKQASTVHPFIFVNGSTESELTMGAAGVRDCGNALRANNDDRAFEASTVSHQKIPSH